MKGKAKIRFHRPERDRMLFTLLRRIRELKPSEAARGTSVSPQTIRAWRTPVAQGGTRYPQFATMDLVARANGLEFVLQEAGETSRRASADAVLHYAAR